MSVGTDFIAGVNEIIATLGNDLLLTDQAGNTRAVRGAITNIPTADEQLVNALGLDGRVVYLKPGPLPLKFDTLTTPTGRTYAVHDVHEILVANTLAGIKLLVKAA